jgi:Arc/MetJ family transcription regulator
VQTRTNIVLDDKLVESAMRKAGVRTKREAVEAALRAFVREADYAALLALRGTGGVAEDYDPKAYGAAQIDAP